MRRALFSLGDFMRERIRRGSRGVKRTVREEMSQDPCHALALREGHLERRYRRSTFLPVIRRMVCRLPTGSRYRELLEQGGLSVITLDVGGSTGGRGKLFSDS